MRAGRTIVVVVGLVIGALWPSGIVPAAPAIGTGPVIPAIVSVPRTVTNDQFTDVACTTPGNCVAVGELSLAPAVQVAVTQTDTAGVWSPVRAAVFPTGIENRNPNDEFTAVSCAVTATCTAVGWFLDAAGNQEAMTMSEANGVWSPARPAVFPAGVASATPNALFTSVSCPAAGGCSAAGQFADAGGHVEAMTATQVNGAWQAVAPAVFGDAPHGTPNDGFAAIECASVGNCTAAGWFLDQGGHQEAMTESLVSGQITPVAAAIIPAGAENVPADEFTSVSCPSASNCTAAGWFLSASGQQRSFIQTETDGQWAQGVPSSVSTNLPSLNQGFTSISCPSVGNCTAVGWSTVASGNNGAVIWSQSAGQWSGLTTATIPSGAQGVNQNDGFTAVSCSTASSCMAVGYFVDASGNRQAMSDRSVNGVWQPVVPASVLPIVGNPNPYDSFTSVACVSLRNCVAAGFFVDATGANEAMTQRTTSALTIPLQRLTNATQATPFRFPLSIAGVTQVVWSLASGALPKGIALAPHAGLLTGTPLKSGVYRFTLRATYGDLTATTPVVLRVVA